METKKKVTFITSPLGAEVKTGDMAKVFYEPLVSNEKLVPQAFVPKSYLTRLGTSPPKSDDDRNAASSLYASPLLSIRKSTTTFNDLKKTNKAVFASSEIVNHRSSGNNNNSKKVLEANTKTSYVTRIRRNSEDLTKSWGNQFMKFTDFEKYVALENLYKMIDEKQRDRIISIFSDDINTSGMEQDDDKSAVVIHEGASVNDSSSFDDSRRMWSVDGDNFFKKYNSEDDGNDDYLGMLDGTLEEVKKSIREGDVNSNNVTTQEEFKRNMRKESSNFKDRSIHKKTGALNSNTYNNNANEAQIEKQEIEKLDNIERNIYNEKNMSDTEKFYKDPISFLLKSVSKSSGTIPCYAIWDADENKLDLYLDSVEGTHLMSGQIVSSEEDNLIRFDICLPEDFGGHRICLLDQVNEVPLAQFNVFTEGHYSDTLYQRPFVSAGAGGGVYKAIQSKMIGSDNLRRQLAAIQIKCEEDAPRKVLVLLPSRNKMKDQARSFILNNEDEDMLSLAANGTRKDMVYLLSKEPEYDKELNGYVLDLDSRISLPSSKNIALERHGKNKTIFSFGKCDTYKYAFSLASPLSFLHGFSIALASIATSIQLDEIHGTDSDYDDTKSYGSDIDEEELIHDEDYYY